jgi:hypothetical protein
MEETATFERQLDPWWTRARSQTNNLLCKKTIHQALEEQVLIINELLEEERDNYYLDDIYNVLPNKITWNGRTGYLKISKYDIVYSSLETELKGQVVVSFSYMIGNLNVFDAFIDAIKFLNKYKEQIIVHE